MNFSSILILVTAHFVALFYWFVAIIRFFFPQNRKDVRGEIVLITGAGSGLGQLMSIKFAKLGCKIVGWDLSEKGLDSTQRKLAEIGLASHWHSFKCDITSRKQVYKLAETVQSEIGDVSILINNAGIVTGKNLNEASDELLLKTMEVNTTAHFWTIKAFLPAMLERNKGHVVTIASGAGLFGIPGLVDYCASKFAAVGLTESLHNELTYNQHTSIKTTLVCPYYINTGMFDGVVSPIVPIIEADDATEQIVDAVLREKVYLLMPRVLYIIYGIKGILPAKCFFILGKAYRLLDRMDTFVGRKNQ